jgi:hypothetical protein
VEAGEAGGDLNFERATYAQPEAGPPCSSCNGPLSDEYWEFSSRPICGNCKRQIAAVLEASRSRATFVRAILLGGATALGCGIAYAIFVQWKNIHVALITIGIAFVIAKVLRKTSGGAGGRRYQVLAVTLTYLASAMGYAPAVLAGFKSSTEAAPAKTSGTAAPTTAAPATAPVEPGDSEGPGTLRLLATAGIILAYMLAAPFLAATEAPIGLLIIGFGLWEAWKLTGGVPLVLGGPYRRTAVATGPPG